MPTSINPAIQQLADLYTFPYYQTREEYETKTGQACPPFNDMLPPKKWRDPAADPRGRRNIVYSNALAFDEKGQYVMATIDGVDYPVSEPLVLTHMQAASVNIPQSGVGSGAPATAIENTVEIAPPFRNLADHEQLFFIWGGVVAVRDRRLVTDTPAGGGAFTAEDRKLLERIASKVGALTQ